MRLPTGAQARKFFGWCLVAAVVAVGIAELWNIYQMITVMK